MLVGVQSHWPRRRQERVNVLRGFLVEDEFEFEMVKYQENLKD